MIAAEADELRLVLVGPPARKLDGVPEMGGFTISDAGDGVVTISGVGLLAGSVVELALTVNDRKADGQVNVDSHTYTLSGGHVVRRSSSEVKITGSARGSSRNRLQVLELVDGDG